MHNTGARAMMRQINIYQTAYFFNVFHICNLKFFCIVYLLGQFFFELSSLWTYAKIKFELRNVQIKDSSFTLNFVAFLLYLWGYSKIKSLVLLKFKLFFTFFSLPPFFPSRTLILHLVLYGLVRV